jgi:hypothetical protein
MVVFSQIFSFFNSAKHNITIETLIPIALFGVLIIFLFLLLKRATSEFLVDSVYDHRNYLVVKNNNKEIKLMLSDIKDITICRGNATGSKSNVFIAPTEVILSLNHESDFGNKIRFAPQVSHSLYSFGAIPLVYDLIDRVKKAKST